MRRSGILLPINSLPSNYGVGTLGQAVRDFIDFLATAGQSLWQILPVGHTGFGDSPYQCFSAFAGNPYNIDLDSLIADGLLKAAEVGNNWGEHENRVDYALLYKKRFAVLRQAAARFDKAMPEYTGFCAANGYWLDDYALFMSIKESMGGVGLDEWSNGLRLRNGADMVLARERFADDVDFWKCVQYLYFSQWKRVKEYANANGIGIVGDIPIYVSGDSSDIWANPELYQLSEDGRLIAVAGCPPDAFTDEGQLWGNPLYNWDVHIRTDFAWWLTRLKFASEIFDITRIDHFRGFASYYSIPFGEKTARNGKWAEGPGEKFIDAVHKHLPHMKIIAEDLGFLTDDVRSLLAKSGYPGMKILQFAFDSREESDYLPHNYDKHTVVYTGTHDNTTAAAWASEASRADADYAMKYLGAEGGSQIADAMIRAAMGSVAETAIIPMQDWLGLDEDGRINKPGSLGENNWCWRLRSYQLSDGLVERILDCTQVYKRAR